MKWDSPYSKKLSPPKQSDDAKAAAIGYAVERLLKRQNVTLQCIDEGFKFVYCVMFDESMIASGVDILEVVMDAEKRISCNHEFGIFDFCDRCKINKECVI